VRPVLLHHSISHEDLTDLFAGRPYRVITRDDVLENMSRYWFTNTRSSAARLYWQQAKVGNLNFLAADTVFPEEYVHALRSWAEKAYHNMICFNEAEKATTSLPGNSRAYFQRNCARHSARWVEEHSGLRTEIASEAEHHAPSMATAWSLRLTVLAPTHRVLWQHQLSAERPCRYGACRPSDTLFVQVTGLRHCFWCPHGCHPRR
jgi:hypothetical protein